MDKIQIVNEFENRWMTKYPNIYHELSDKFWNTVEIMDENPLVAIKQFNEIIEIFPEHFDAILHLGNVYEDGDQYYKARECYISAFKIAYSLIPDNYNPETELLEWSFMENRPVLRTFHNFGLMLMNENNFKEAIEIFNFIINSNPNDNQGIRYLLGECYFALKKPNEFLNLTKLYPDDYSIDFMYGKVLAYFQIGKKKQAEKFLDIASKEFPNGIIELLKKRHIFPKNEFEESLYGFPVGSKIEAYDYWMRTKAFWKENPTVFDFLKNYNC